MAQNILILVTIYAPELETPTSASFAANPLSTALTSPFASELSASPLVDTTLHILSAVLVIRSMACWASRGAAA